MAENVKTTFPGFPRAERHLAAFLGLIIWKMAPEPSTLHQCRELPQLRQLRHDICRRFHRELSSTNLFFGNKQAEMCPGKKVQLGGDSQNSLLGEYMSIMYTRSSVCMYTVHGLYTELILSSHCQ